MATQIGPKIGIEGEKEYRDALKQIVNQTKNLDAAMQKTVSTWDENTSAMTKNSAIAKNLQQQVGLQASKLEIMNQVLEESKAKYGENAAATQSWQRAVDYTTASLNHMEQQLKSLGGAANFSALSQQMADVGTKMQNIGSSMTAVGQKLTMSLTLPIAAAGAASVKLASDLEESTNKVDAVFGTMSESVKAFADNALDSYGLAESSALQMASTFGAMASAMGISRQESADMSMSLTALSADMSSFYNVSTDVASKSLEGIFTGETEALKKFGVVMTQTNLEAFAQQQGKVYSKMSEAEKVMTRYAFVMNATKDAQGDFARTSDGTANSIRVFKESVKELGAAFGEALLPIITPIIQIITKVVQAIASLPAPIRAVIAVIALIVAAIGPIILIIGSLVTAMGSIITNAPLVAAALVKIGAGAAAMGATLAAALPQLLLIVAIAALVIAAGVAIAKNWDEICEAADEMGSKVSEAWQKLLAKNDELKSGISSLISDIVGYFKQLPSKIANTIRQAIDDIKSTFDQMIQTAKTSGKDFIEGFVEGIEKTISKVVNAVKKVADTIKDYLGFSCPDKGPLSEYETWMPDMMMGLAKGINQNKGIVTRAINSLAKDMSLPLSADANMNMALAGADGGSMSAFGGTTLNVYVDHINDLNDLIRIQNQAQQMSRMGAR